MFNFSEHLGGSKNYDAKLMSVRCKKFLKSGKLSAELGNGSVYYNGVTKAGLAIAKCLHEFSKTFLISAANRYLLTINGKTTGIIFGNVRDVYNIGLVYPDKSRKAFQLFFHALHSAEY